MEKNGDIVRRLYDAFGKGDLTEVLGGFDSRIQWREAENSLYADGNPYVGPQAVAQGVFQRCVADVADLAVVPERFIEGGDSVVVEGRYQGKMKATGMPLDAQFAHVWELRSGKVVRFQQYTDTTQWAQASAAGGETQVVRHADGSTGERLRQQLAGERGEAP